MLHQVASRKIHKYCVCIYIYTQTYIMVGLRKVEKHGETFRDISQGWSLQKLPGEDGQRKYFYNTTSREASHHHPDSTVRSSTFS